ncbi:AAA family ATPase [Thermodesulfobacteriota bacterium]
MKSTKRKKSKPKGKASADLEKSQLFVRKKVAAYLDRLLTRDPSLDEEMLVCLHWLLGPPLLEDAVQHMTSLLSDEEKTKFENQMEESLLDKYDFARNLEALVRKSRRDLEDDLALFIRKLLKRKIKELRYSGRSDIEKSVALLKKMFKLNNLEAEICLLLFIISEWYPAECFFEDHLRCTYYSGRNHLSTMLGVTGADVTKALHGRLSKIGMLEVDERSPMTLESSLAPLFQNPSASGLTTEFFKRIHPTPIPLEAHMMDETVTEHVLDLLRQKPETSTHLLLHGPPGTGKTSFAHGIGKKLSLPIYQVEHGGKDSNWRRIAAITACVNMTTHGSGSLVIVDDCDVILNTGGAYDDEGQYADKKMLHDILEEPGVRMIWIANDIYHVAESVVRRFSYSVPFRAFSRIKRIRLWENILRRHKCKRFFNSSDLQRFATDFQCSPGSIDHAVRKALEIGPTTKDRFHSAVAMCLEAHDRLLNGGSGSGRSRKIDPVFTLEGLNVTGADLRAMLKELESFDKHLRSSTYVETASMKLLFHGPPGTGKSRMARHIATHLDREAACNRASDLLSKWVGETEQNIRKAYEDAAAKEALLIFDEADSLVLSRERTQHSWESSLTNEFLTQMEDFRGVQIFTTNRLKDLDSASLRRFTYKVEFHYLKPEGNIIFYRLLLAPLVNSPMNRVTEEALKHFGRLTPGDFKTIRDRFQFRTSQEVSHKTLLAALREEEKIKAAHAGEKPIGFA